MIYNNTYFKEQLKKTYIEGENGKIALAFCVVTIALITLIVHNFFYTMQETVVSNVLPYLTKYSFFAMLSVYNAVIIVFFIGLFTVKYKRLTIAEISTNKWYLLIKTGYSPIKLVFSKISANIISVACIYSLSFVVLIFIGSLMHLEMQINAIFSLALIGLIQVFFVVELIMGISVFVKRRGDCFLFVLIGLVLMYLLMRVTGFNKVITSVVKMEDTSYLFVGKTSIYVYLLMVIAFLMLFLGGIQGWLLSINYKPKAQLGENVYSVNYVDGSTKFVKWQSKYRYSIVKIVAKSALAIIVVTSIVVNIGIIMLASFNRPNAGMGNHIMMIFESETMSGKLEKNDFVWFKKIAPTEILEAGDIILYYDNNKPIVQIVERVNEDGSYLVDYINYPYGTEEDSCSKYITTESIAGICVENSAWLGAFFIWNKSIVAKILTTILPTLILVFYNKIEKIILLIKSTAGTDEEDDRIAVNRKEYLTFYPKGAMRINLSEIEEEETAPTKQGLYIRYSKSFTARLIQAPDSTKDYYTQIKNALLSIKGVKSRVSWKYESFNIGRKQFVKLNVCGKTLSVYFAIDPTSLENSKYKVDIADANRYEKVPCQYKIRSKRRVKYSLELINKLMQENTLVLGKPSQEDFASKYPYESTTALLQKNLIKDNKK